MSPANWYAKTELGALIRQRLQPMSLLWRKKRREFSVAQISIDKQHSASALCAEKRQVERQRRPTFGTACRRNADHTRFVSAILIHRNFQIS